MGITIVSLTRSSLTSNSRKCQFRVRIATGSSIASLLVNRREWSWIVSMRFLTISSSTFLFDCYLFIFNLEINLKKEKTNIAKLISRKCIRSKYLTVWTSYPETVIPSLTLICKKIVITCIKIFCIIKEKW